MTDSLVRSVGAAPRHELRYRVEAADYAAFVRKVRWTLFERVVSSFGVLGAGFVGWVTGLVVWIVARDALTAVEPIDALLILTAFFMLVGIAVHAAILQPAYVTSVFRAQPIGGGDTVLIADAAGVSSSVGSVTIATPWRRIVPVETDTHLFLFFSRITAHIVPKRDLADAAGFAAFVRANATGGA
jgi:hypothetical protein